jgi:hypothetical protein
MSAASRSKIDFVFDVAAALMPPRNDRQDLMIL